MTVANETELRASQLLSRLTPFGYLQLTDRRWPGSSRANVDLVLIGPSGVYVVDTKCWAEVSIVRDRIFRGLEHVTHELDGLRQLTDRTRTRSTRSSRGAVSASRFDDYARVHRVGRRFPLTVDQRESLWRLYTAYLQQLQGLRIQDPNSTDTRPDLLAAPRRAQFLVLGQVLAPGRGPALQALWATLSRAAHAHVLELAPTSGELTRWRDEAAEARDLLATAQPKVTAAVRLS